MSTTKDNTHNFPILDEKAPKGSHDVDTLPWHLERGSFDYVIGSDGNPIVFCDSDKPEIAPFIVTACNSHDDLLAALAYLILIDAEVKGAVWPQEVVDWARIQLKDEKRVGVEMIRDAIRKAESSAT